MNTISNRLYRGIVDNTGNPRSHFQYFAIETVKEMRDDEGGIIFDMVKDADDYFDRTSMIGEPFYSIFGSFKPDHVQSGMSIATLDNLSDAIRLVEMLSGNTIKEYP